jgi:hypothetical protein
MVEEIRKEWRKAMWTLVAAAVLAIASSYVQVVVSQNTMQKQIDILQSEQGLLRTKVDLLQVVIERKVDRDKMDDCLSDINHKLDGISVQLIDAFKLKHQGK